MNTLNDSQGCSVVGTPGKFHHVKFISGFNGKGYVQWDYRDSKGTLHSGVSRTVEGARLDAQIRSGETIR